MRTSKKLFLFGLAAIVAGSMLIPPTFSWYDHNGTQAGGIMKYQRDALPISNGSVTMETKKLRMDTNNPTLLFYDEKGQKQTTGNALQNDTVNTGGVQYYRTLFTNTRNSAAMVNLYLTNYTNEPGLYLGTIYPTITEKNQAGQASKIPKSRGSIRVYFEDRNTTGWNGSTAKYVVTNGGAQKLSLTRTPKNEKDGAAVSTSTSNSNWVYYADLPAGTTSFYFYSATGDTNTSDGWYKTRTFTEIKNGVIYYLTQKAVQDGSNNAECKELVMDNLVSASQYYETITMSQDQYVDVTLGDSYYTGKSISYSVISGSGTVSLDTNTNILTRTSAASNATLRTTVTGVLDDELLLDTTITTPALLDSVPVVMNLKVPPKDEKISESSDESKGTREVVWYIRNDGSSAGSFSNIIFTK